MSLRPVTKSRHRGKPRYVNVRQKKWRSDWNWHPKRPLRETVLGLFGNKRFVLAVVILVILASTIVLAHGPLFHSEQKAPCAPDYAKPGAPCEDPSQVIWQATDPNGNLAEFNTYAGSGSITRVAACQSGGTSCIQENPGNTTVIALSKTSVGDLSVASKSLLAFHMTLGSNFALNSNIQFGWYLTTNATVPTHALGSLTQYFPDLDPSVVLEVRYFCSANCGTANPTYGAISEALRTIGHGDTMSGENTGSGQSGSTYLSNSQTLSGPTILDSSFYLNYTGVVNSSSCTVSGSPGVIGPAPGCSWLLLQGAGGLATSGFWQSTTQLPWFQLQSQQYYIGFFAEPSIGGNPGVFFTFNNGGTNGNMDVFQFVPQTTGPTIDTGGFFGPVIKALIGIGVFILNALLSFVAFIAPAIQTALSFLESIIQAILNLIGNALGFGNVGTTLFSLLNSIVTFFTNSSYGFPAFFGFFATYITNFLRYLQIDFQFLNPVFTIANAILIFGVNGVAEAFVIFLQGVNMLFFGYGTFIVFAYFLYVGDDGIGGLFTFLGTLEAISFKILNSIVTVTNVGLDFLVVMVSLVPKPFIQMSAARIPRLPTVEYAASMSFPSLDFGEARNGNLIVYWLWCMGLWFVCWFESQNPALPGSLAAIYTNPTWVANIRQLSAYIPLLQAATLVSGGLVLAWFAMLPMRLAGIDVTESPLGASLGRRTGPGPSGVSISFGKKHLIGPAKKAEQERQRKKGHGGKAEKEAKKVVEKQKEKLEKEKRDEELRKREIARKPTGKDLKGPNLGPLGPQ